MEYAPGRTASELLAGTDDTHERDLIYASIGLALSELTRIPVPDGARPAAIDGDRILHSLFDDYRAPVSYQSVQQLEDHLNAWLSGLWIKKTQRLKDLTREPLVFCYSDLWLGNFIIDEQKHVTVVDFAIVSILPSSFFKYDIVESTHKLKRDISDLVTVPSTPGVDNTEALLACQASLAMSPSGFSELGVELLGEAEWPGDGGRDGRHTLALPQKIPLLDSEGRQIAMSYRELHPDYVEELDATPGQPSPPRDRPSPPEWLKELIKKIQSEDDSPPK